MPTEWRKDVALIAACLFFYFLGRLGAEDRVAVWILWLACAALGFYASRFRAWLAAGAH